MLDQDLLDLGLKFHGHKCPAERNAHVKDGVAVCRPCADC